MNYSYADYVEAFSDSYKKVEVDMNMLSRLMSL